MPAKPSLPPLAPGDIAPRFVLPRANGGARFDSQADEIAGRPQALAFAETIDAAPVAALLKRRGAIEALGAHVLAVVRRAPDTADDCVLVDGDGRMTAHFAGGAAGLALIRPNGHAVLSAPGPAPEGLDRMEALLREMQAAAAPRPAERQAPVLIVPNVLSPADCQRLMTVYNMDGNVFVEPGHGVQDRKADYKMRIPEYGRKDRIDHWVVNPQTMGFINDRLQRRLFPEIQKAFHYRVTKHERYRIGCYEGARGGELHGHRDNTQPNVAHRRFACSVNLNAEDFEGGELAFPEFGGQRFSPATGEAVVFSSSILHEPLHVTKGRRLVLLAFLFGET